MTDGLGIDELLAEREITRSLIGIARGMDARDWDAVRARFLPDATAEMGSGPLEGVDAIVATMQRYLDACGPTQHMLGNFLVEIDLAAGTATSQAYVSDVHLGRGDRRGLTFSTLGDYHDRWERHDGTWLIRHRHKLSRAIVGSFEVFELD